MKENNEASLEIKTPLIVSSAPHLRSGDTTKGIMRDVIIALVPTSIAALYLFGIRSLIVMAACILSAVLSEYIFERLAGKRITIGDLSAVVTGLLLALNLPVTIPIWQACLGSVFAIVIVKQCFGGIGSNFMNPALAARAVMLTSFAGPMSSFVPPHTENLIEASSSATELAAISTATPLAGGKASYMDLFMGNIPGSMGEVCKLAILIGLIYLLVRRVITLEIPLVYVLSTLATIFVASKGQADLVMHLLSGGLLLGAVFMATDYATSPTTRKGKVVFAIGCGILTAIIRLFAGNPEGVSYAIIIMNMFVPLIDRFTKKKVFGTGGND